MKRSIVISAMVALAAGLWSGCGKSSSDSNASAPSAPAVADQPTSNSAATPATALSSPSPAASTQTPASAFTGVPAPAAPIPTVSANVPAPSSAPTSTPTPAPAPEQLAAARSAALEPVSQFAASASAQTDKVAASIGSELATKAQSLTQSAGANSALKTQLAGAMQSLSAGNDAGALTTLFQQAKQANLTPQQTQLAKDVGNLASAYVVQRNFSSLDGAQGNVATIVNSLRKGSVMPAVPALESLAQNASLTPKQKDLLSTVADQYAPGLKKTSDSLKQGLQSLQGLSK